MRKITLLLLILVLSSCGSTKTESNETQNLINAKNWINDQNFTVVTPDYWRPVKHHGYVGYTPIKKGNNHFNNMVSIFQYQLKDKPGFKEFAFGQMKKNNYNWQEVQLAENSQFDAAYAYISESEGYKNYIVYFEHNGEYFNYNYSSLKPDYESHFEEAMSILKSIKFK